MVFFFFRLRPSAFAVAPHALIDDIARQNNGEEAAEDDFMSYFVMSGIEKWVEFSHVKLQKSLRFERITGLIFYKKCAITAPFYL